jgi:hypothetical protein
VANSAFGSASVPSFKSFEDLRARSTIESLKLRFDALLAESCCVGHDGCGSDKHIPGMSAVRMGSNPSVRRESCIQPARYGKRIFPKGDGFLSVTKSAPDADRYGDESDANP